MRTLQGKWLVAVAAGVVFGVKAGAVAAPPWQDLLTFQKVEADPNKSYRLTQENGPWLIMASSFSGERAEEQAKELVHELRKRYKMTAYVHRMHFDVGDQVAGRGVDRYGQPVRMRYQRPAQFEEIAVMVGDFHAVDDPAVQRTLEKIRYSHPECLKASAGRPTSQNLAAWRTFAKYVSPERESLGPMGKAFVTTNPLLPKEYFAPKGVDAIVERMNSGLPHSLLNCPGKYTVQVALFTGSATDNADLIKKIEQGVQELESNLDKAGIGAHKLTEALRLKGYEAYEFHDRNASIVTVGSFDSVGTPRPDGKIEINPKVHAIMELFKAQPATLPGAGPKAKTLVGIPFDPQPVPVEVPRRSISADYGREVAGR